MKRFMRVIIALLITGVLFLRYYPIKSAVDEDSVELSGKDYIICRAAYATGFHWIVEKSSSSYEGFVFVEGVMEDPYSFDYNVIPHTLFVLYGSFIGERIFSDEMIPIFKAESWDVLKPVDRGSMPGFLSPPYGLSWFDFVH